MCLAKVTRRNPSSKEDVGYKALAKNLAGKMYSCYQHGKMRTYPTGKWITDTNHHSVAVNSIRGMGTFPAGFHIFKNKRDAERWSDIHIHHPVIVRVKYRRVSVTGLGYWHEPIVVARQMLIEKVY